MEIALHVPASAAKPALEFDVIGGRYKLLREIGRGSLGIVYEARHLLVDRRFAIKILQVIHRDEPALQSRFRQEAQVGGALHSPFTVPVFDYGVHLGVPFLVMEMLEGVTLAQALRDKAALPRTPSDVNWAVRRVIEACHGVAVAHALGILHRDLKPANLFLCRSGETERCRVLDFGVAKQLDEAELATAPPTTATGAIVGTLAYMSPEQIRGEALDERSEVYALGVILYEAVAGRRLFVGQTQHALMYQILEQQLQPLSSISSACAEPLSACIERALAGDKRLRHASVTEFAQDLEGALGTVQQHVPNVVGARPNSAETRRKSPGLVWKPAAFGLCCLSLGVLVGAGLAGVHRNTPPSLTAAQQSAPAVMAPMPEAEATDALAPSLSESVSQNRAVGSSTLHATASDRPFRTERAAERSSAVPHSIEPRATEPRSTLRKASSQPAAVPVESEAAARVVHAERAAPVLSPNLGFELKNPYRPLAE